MSTQFQNPEQAGIGKARASSPFGAGIDSCGASHASQSVDANDRQVRASLFIVPGKSRQHN
jgi:hypothetical protein